MTISIADANALLDSVSSFEELRNLISQLDVTGTGTNTVLYSGGFGANTDAHGIAVSLANSNPNIRIVDNTSAAKFLDFTNNETLKLLLVRLGGDPEESGYDGKGNKIGEPSESNKFLFNVNYGDGLGAWATVSKNFVASPATEGNVRVIAPFADATRVFAEVELKELLKNPNVDQIDGNSKADYQRLANSAETAGRNGHAVVLSAVVNGSGEAVSRLQIPTDQHGVVQSIDKTPTTIGTVNYFNDGTVTGQPIPEGVHSSSATNVIITARGDEKVSVPKNIDPKTHLENSQFANEQLKNYANEQRAAAIATGDPVALANAEKALNKLGIVGDAIALGFAINEANAAYAAGDTNKAIDTMTKWGLELAGGVAGGVAAASLASSVLAPMYLMGPIGIVVAGGLSLLAGIAGGVLGGDAFVRIFGAMVGIDEEKPDMPKPLPPDFPPPPLRDPLALDLDGDGIVNTLPMSRGIHFDLDNSGFAEKTSWVAPGDGLLVLDRNNNGFIDGGAELFGTETLLSTGKYARHGFEALTDFDDNQDGVIDSNDAVYSSIRVWRDVNSNGVADSEELKSLAELNIKSIGTAYKDTSVRDANNVEHREAGMFTYSNSTKGITNTLWFESDRRITVPVTELQGNAPISDAIKKLPNAIGFGNTYSLHQAMAMNANSDLQKKVQAFSIELNPEKRRLLLREILVLWTGVGDVIAGSRGGEVDATSLSIMESFWGQPALQDKPFGAYAYAVNEAYMQLEKSVYSQLMAGTHMRDLLGLTYFNENDGVLTADYTQVVDIFRESLIARNPFSSIQVNEFIATIEGITPKSSDLVRPFLISMYPYITAMPEQQKAIVQELYNNHRGILKQGTSSGYAILGVQGDDSFLGGLGNDVLIGGEGNDRLHGGSGADSYLFNKGDGQDSIFDWDNTGGIKDRIVFGYGLLLESFAFTRNKNDLLVSFSDDSIKILDYFTSEDHRIEEVVIEDKVFSLETLMDDYVVDVQGASVGDDTALHGTRQANTINALDGADRVYGYEGNDTLWGGLGADTLYGGVGDDALFGQDSFDFLFGDDGNDYLDGGAASDDISGGIGNDVISGGAGNDRIVDDAGDDEYRFDLGDGHDIINDAGGVDKIVFSPSITPDMVTVNRDGATLIFNIGAADSITVNLGRNDINSLISVDYVVFANDVVWDIPTIISKTLEPTSGNDILHGTLAPETIKGAGGDDYIYAYGGDDVIEGGSGNDTLHGGEGGDTYQFSVGAGHDIIWDYSEDAHDIDAIEFSAEIKPSDISFSRTETNLILKVNNNDSLHVVNFFDSNFSVPERKALSRSAIEKIIFSSSGEELNVSQIISRLSTIGSSSSDTIYGTNLDELIDGKSGNDTLHGGGGADTIQGGAGADSLFGEMGDDYLLGGDGNDELYDYWGNNIYQGGKGVDKIWLHNSFESDYGNGTSVIRYGLDDGVDTIIGAAKNTVRIELGLGITEDMLFVDSSSISIKGTADKLIGIQDNSFYEIVLDSGKVIRGQDLSARMNWFRTNLAADRCSISGKTEPNLTLKISYLNWDNSLTVLPDVIAGADGSYHLDLGFAVKNPSRILVVGVDQFDRQQVFSVFPSASPAVAPSSPVAQVDALGLVIYGVAEPGVTVVAYDGDKYIGSAHADVINGSYTIIPNNPLKSHTVNNVVAKRVVNTVEYASSPTAVSVPFIDRGNDSSPPEKPTGVIDPTGTVITGTAEPGSLVYAKDYTFGADNNLVLGFTTADLSGNFKLELIEPQIDGSEVSLVSVDKAGNNSGVTIYSIDSTRPLPAVAQFDSAGKVISGRAETPKDGQPTQVIIMDASSSQILGTQQLNYSWESNFKITIPAAIKSGDFVNVYVRDFAGNLSSAAQVFTLDTIKPLLNSATFDNSYQFISGVAEAGSIIKVIDKSNSLLIGAAVADIKGNYTVTLKKALIKSESISITATDKASNVSTPIGLTAPDKTPPEISSVLLDTSRSIVSGVAEPGSIVKVMNENEVLLKSVVANSVTGNFSIALSAAVPAGESIMVTATDKVGNKSSAIVLGGAPVDSTPPEAPTAEFGELGEFIAGVAEAGSLVEAKHAVTGELLGTAIASQAGAYTIGLNVPLINREAINVTARDTANNVSAIKVIVAPDKTPPKIESAVFDATGAAVSGIAEPGVVVRVKNLENKVLGGAVADAVSGAFTIVLNAPLTNNERVKVYARDEADNYSASLSIYAPDKTAPLAPAAELDAARKIINGTAEAGSVINVLDSTNKLLKTTRADATTGAYSITLSTALSLGQSVKVTSTDKSGNVSPAFVVSAGEPDTTPPDIFSVGFDASGGIVSGVAEVGVLVRVKNLNGDVLGGSVADAVTGAFSIALANPLINKERVKVYARDAAGNYSPSISISAPDKTPPQIPVATLDITRKIVSGTAEVGSTIKVIDENNKVLKTVRADSTTGVFTLALSTAVADGAAITITATDRASNVSAPLVLRSSAVFLASMLDMGDPVFLDGPVVDRPAALYPQLDNLVQAIATFAPDDVAVTERTKPYSHSVTEILAVGF